MYLIQNNVGPRHAVSSGFRSSVPLGFYIGFYLTGLL